MTTAYPGALDDWGNPSDSTRLDDPTLGHAAAHANLNDAVEAIQAELGVTPSGSAATVAARFDALDSAVATLPAGIKMYCVAVDGVYTRPTARTDISVEFIGTVDPDAAALNDVDTWVRPV